MKALAALGVALVVSAVLVRQAESSVMIAESATVLGDFELTDQEGQSFRFSSLRGHAALIFFGFTHCPDVCPATMHRLRLLEQAQRSNGKPSPLVVMISVDGARDTPAAMKSYLQPLSSDFIGLTGDPVAVRGIAANFSAVFFKGLPGDKSGNYQVQHTSFVYLVDPQGRLRATFSDASLDEMSRVIGEILSSPAPVS